MGPGPVLVVVALVVVFGALLAVVLRFGNRALAAANELRRQAEDLEAKVNDLGRERPEG